MKFKVTVEKIDTNKLKGWIFSILHPQTTEPIYEFYHQFQKLGKDICEEIIADINEGLSKKIEEKE